MVSEGGVRGASESVSGMFGVVVFEGWGKGGGNRIGVGWWEGGWG